MCTDYLSTTSTLNISKWTSIAVNRTGKKQVNEKGQANTHWSFWHHIYSGLFRQYIITPLKYCNENTGSMVYQNLKYNSVLIGDIQYQIIIISIKHPFMFTYHTMYLRFYYYYKVASSDGGLLIPAGIISPVISTSALTWFIRYYGW